MMLLLILRLFEMIMLVATVTLCVRQIKKIRKRGGRVDYRVFWCM